MHGICLYKGYEIEPGVQTKHHRDHYAYFTLRRDGDEVHYVVRPNYMTKSVAWEAAFHGARQLIDRVSKYGAGTAFAPECQRSQTVVNKLRRRLFDRSQGNRRYRKTPCVHLRKLQEPFYATSLNRHRAP